MRKIIILGDSIYKGTQIKEGEQERYIFTADNILDEIGQKLDIKFYNNSVFGLTTQKVVERNRHLKDLEENVTERVLISLGSNDCDFDWAAVAEAPDQEHFPKVAPEQYILNLTKIAQDIMAKGIPVALVSLVPIHATRFFDFITRNISKEGVMKWLDDKQILYMWQEYYSNIVMTTARKLNVPFIDIRKYFVKNHNFAQLISADGMHLTPIGYKILSEKIVEEYRDIFVKE